MNYGAGFKATYYAAIIDPLSWTEKSKIQIKGGSVKRQKTGLRQTADIDALDFDQTKEVWLRVFMDARQDENISHNAVFTGVVSVPNRELSGPIITRTLDCYSVLKPCEDIVLPRGWYAAAGENAGAILRSLLSVSPAPVEIEGHTPSLADHIVAEDGETNLTMVDKILDAIGRNLIIKGDGTIVIKAPSSEPAITFSATGLDIIEPSLTVTRDWFKCPNVFKAASGDLTAEKVDDDPNSPLSVVARGRKVIMAEYDVKLSSSEGIEEYAARRLREEQQTEETADYDRVFVPDLNVGDVVKMVYPEIAGEYVIEEQTIELTFGGKTAEKIVRTVPPENAVELQRKAWALVVLPDNKYFVMPDGYRVLVPYSTLIHS